MWPFCSANSTNALLHPTVPALLTISLTSLISIYFSLCSPSNNTSYFCLTLSLCSNMLIHAVKYCSVCLSVSCSCCKLSTVGLWIDYNDALKVAGDRVGHVMTLNIGWRGVDFLMKGLIFILGKRRVSSDSVCCLMSLNWIIGWWEWTMWDNEMKWVIYCILLWVRVFY
jgi:hypothetical protein